MMPRGARPRAGAAISAIALLALLIATLFANPARGANSSHLRLTTLIPDQVTPGKGLLLIASVQNLGDAPLSGDLNLRYAFPAGLQPADPTSEIGPDPECQTYGQLVECTLDATGLPSGAQLRFRTPTAVQADATGILAGAIVVSGGDSGEHLEEPFSLDTGPPGPFALRSYELEIDDGAYPAAQAGAVPPELRATASLYSEARTNFDVPLPNVYVTATPESLRDAIVHLPAGLIGNPTATPRRCSAAQLNTVFSSGSTVPACPPESQIGLVQINGANIVPLYNLVPPLGSPAALGLWFVGVPITLYARLRPSDDGIDLVARQAPSAVPLPKLAAYVWGTPGDSAHDHLRTTCLNGYFGATGADCPLDAPDPRPFLRMPTSCTGEPLPWSVEVDSYQHPGSYVGAATTTPPVEGCQLLPFEPQISIELGERRPHTPTGLDFTLAMPQQNTPAGLAQADVRSIAIELPEGLTINPAAASGLEACSDQALRLDLDGPSRCPEASRLGTVNVHTPLLDHNLPGYIVLRSQASRDPASGDLFRLAIELRSDRDGLAIRIPGSLRADPDTGRLTAVFDDLAELPFYSLRAQLKAGPRAPLTTPPACGTYAARATLTSWARPQQTVPLTAPLTVDQDCAAAPFDPGFDAGTEDATAGAFSPFGLRLTRDSGQPNLARLRLTLPRGEVAGFAGLDICPESAVSTGTCPDASRIGHLSAAVGEGTSPLFLPQPGHAPAVVYLAGPYRGAPYSVLAVVPAQAGAFDLGTVIVRAALRIDPHSARATVVSDPLPQIFAGVPIAYRDLRVDVDRPRFTLNGTSCRPSAVAARLESTLAEPAIFSHRFQLADCPALPFHPRLRLRLRGAVHRRAHPALIATLRARPGDANIARAQVKLPKAAFLDNSHIGTVCTRVQFAARACPPDSIYGRASLRTPLLDYPLTGNVYLRSSSHPLPDLVVDLRGPGPDPIEIVLDGRSDSAHGALRSTFAAIPDAPVSTFHLELFGGKRGLIEISSGFCAAPRASVKLDGQNGRIYDTTPKLSADCGGRHHPSRGGRYRR
jgi:hypothetical protein